MRTSSTLWRRKAGGACPSADCVPGQTLCKRGAVSMISAWWIPPPQRVSGPRSRVNFTPRKRGLEGESEALLNRARDTDAEEDARFGELLRGDELPEEMRRRENRLAAIVAGKERLRALVP